MIYLTKTDKDATRFLLNHKKIVRIEKHVANQRNLVMDNDKIFTVVETEEEIIEKIVEFEAKILARAMKLTSGEKEE